MKNSIFTRKSYFIKPQFFYHIQKSSVIRIAGINSYRHIFLNQNLTSLFISCERLCQMLRHASKM